MGWTILSPHPFNCKISHGQVTLKQIFKLYQLFSLKNYDFSFLNHMGGGGGGLNRLGGERTD